MSCSASTFAIIHRGKRWLRRPTLAAIKSEAKEAGSMRIDEGGGFLGRVLDFFLSLFHGANIANELA